MIAKYLATSLSMLNVVRPTWNAAAAGLMCGSMPLAEAVIRSTGIGASLSGSACRSRGAVDALIHRAGLAEANLVMILLLSVVYSAARYGRGPGIFASIASVLLFDFFFVPPYLTFAVSDTQYLITFAVMFGIAILTSTLASRIRAQAETSRERARRTEALYNMGRRLAGQVGSHQLADVAARQAAATFGGETAVFLPDVSGRLKLASGQQVGFAAKENELAVAQWVFAHQQQAGLGTNTLPS